MTFLGDRDGDGDGTGRTNGQTDGHMDRQTFLGKYYFRLTLFEFSLLLTSNYLLFIVGIKVALLSCLVIFSYRCDSI